MNVLPGLASAFFGLLSGVTWGSGDFCGGLAARRAPSFTVVLVAEFVGAVLLAALAMLFREALPATAGLWWSAGAGLAGVIGLLALYQGFAIGKMGVVAPLSGLVSTIVPVVAAIFLDGWPRALQLAGFVLAMAAVWLLSSGGEFSARPQELGLALVAGLGFGLYFVLIARVSSSSLWNLSFARTLAGLVVLGVVLLRRLPLLPPRPVLPINTLNGVLDAGGNLFFLLAAQSGRLDVAAVLASLYSGVTVLLAWIFLRERLKRPQAVGVVLALAAIALIVW